ncbi:hypothetical protein CRG98_043205 [Punica granatum]|uniref:Uncharacterized protein n=1 Tax=Punica granatum TaxID=22663 RepID=A0A2I0HXS0_PUNGR|nr:hypothetical protein CRG98_043205 [Punica granatum]
MGDRPRVLDLWSSTSGTRPLDVRRPQFFVHLKSSFDLQSSTLSHSSTSMPSLTSGNMLCFDRRPPPHCFPSTCNAHGSSSMKTLRLPS